MSCSAFTSCILLCPRSEWYFMLFYGKHNMEETAETVMITAVCWRRAWWSKYTGTWHQKIWGGRRCSWQKVAGAYHWWYKVTSDLNVTGTCKIWYYKDCSQDWFNLMQSKAHKFQGSCSLTSCVTKRLHQLWMFNSESKKHESTKLNRHYFAETNLRLSSLQNGT